MIEIKRCEDEKIFEEYAIEKSPDTVVMAAKDRDLAFGIAAAKVLGECAIITRIETKDEYKMFEMDFGLGKSILNLLDLSGIRFVFSDIDDKRLFTALRFTENGEIPPDCPQKENHRFFLCLDGYFTAHEC